MSLDLCQQIDESPGAVPMTFVYRTRSRNTTVHLVRAVIVFTAVFAFVI